MTKDQNFNTCNKLIELINLNNILFINSTFDPDFSSEYPWKRMYLDYILVLLKFNMYPKAFVFCQIFGVNQSFGFS